MRLSCITLQQQQLYLFCAESCATDWKHYWAEQ